MLRLVVFAITALVVLAVTIWAEDAIIGAERDLVERFAFLTRSPT